MRNTIVLIISFFLVIINFSYSIAQVDSIQNKFDSAIGRYSRESNTISLKENNEYDGIFYGCIGPPVITWGKWHQQDSIVVITVIFNSIIPNYLSTDSLIYRIIDQNRFLCRVVQDSTTIKKILVNVEDKNQWGCFKTEQKL